MGIDFHGIIPVIIFGGGAAVLGLSYVAVYLMGKNAGRKELEWRAAREVSPETDRLDRVEMAVESIALGVERLGEGQRYLLGSLSDERPVKAAPKSERRHPTPV
ncbi:MAG TPA: hypothetical protein VL308_04795 [Gemmatimonadaceae bacterium]|jgi:hypothetical protein|nr:hypothetical protein [Gemmatimonadaceae bacterium]